MTKQYKSITCVGCGRRLLLEISKYEQPCILDIICNKCRCIHYYELEGGEIKRSAQPFVSTRTYDTATTTYDHVKLDLR